MQVTRERWTIAQKSEKNHWENKQEPEEPGKYWENYLGTIEKYVDIKSQNKILDVGCGSYGIINYIGRQACKYGLDSLIDFYLLNFKMPDTINWIKGRGEDIPFKNECFDIIFTTNTLDHVEQPGRLLREVSRVAKKGGFLILTVNCYGPLHRLYRKMREKLGRGDEPHPFSFSPRGVKKLLKESGFTLLFLTKTNEKNAIKKWGLDKKKMAMAKIIFWIDKRLSGYHTTEFLFISKAKMG